MVNVVLTSNGARYARALDQESARINRRLADQVEHADLVTADAVLRTFISDRGLTGRVDEMVPPPRRQHHDQLRPSP